MLLRSACFCAVLFAVIVSFTTRADVDDAALMSARPARQLSAYGLFENAPKQTPTAGVVPYDLQVPLFTDYAEKYRFVYVPNGTAATYDDTEVFAFPVGSVLVKTFAYPADMRAADENVRLIETRLLIHQEKGWNAWAYVWNEDQTDATLKVAGTMTSVDFVDDDGIPQSINYIVPNKNQCKGCHSLNGKLSPIGPKARNLNKDFGYDGSNWNQLQWWQDKGILKGLPAYDSIPVLPRINDEAAPLDHRARAYLDINCAHCHRVEGPGSTSGLFLTYGEQNPTTWGYEKRPVAAGRGSGGFSYDIAPGDADSSIIVHRMKSIDPGVMMPEVGRTTVHAEGLALIRAWINDMK
ncbi:SO2930 family diheme c-type cytochrome [Kordiimonas aquimaris]|uniref:SO2930 family diheme c-type cytochrome n=1 Tax=Kordiimonas aquimaris TaxID=707591 RepID=UPI0021D29C17|nr:SO2930 family diheme c-type cytochrome [Kordiimonas aquimaris]